MTRAKRTEDVAQAIEFLPQKHKALNSNPHTGGINGGLGGKKEAA
jgi:hypothetical protein